MAQDDELTLVIIGAALIASRSVDIHDFDRQLLDRIMDADENVTLLLQLPAMRQLRTLSRAIRTVLCAPAAAVRASGTDQRDLLAESQKCRHPSCRCQVTMGQPYWPYCSEHCKEAGAEIELRCDCQHSECRLAQQRAGE